MNIATTSTTRIKNPPIAATIGTIMFFFFSVSSFLHEFSAHRSAFSPTLALTRLMNIQSVSPAFIEALKIVMKRRGKGNIKAIY